MRNFFTGLRRLCDAGRISFCLLAMAGMSIGNLTAATILFSAEPLGGTSYRYTYRLLEARLLVNQELAVEFDPLLYRNLSNAAAGAQFSVALVQPDNPPGAVGRYSALALADDPSLAVPFRVTLDFLGAGTPGSQPFFINQFNENQQLPYVIESGLTTPTPEPASEQLAGLGLLLGGAFLVIRRRCGGTT
jgi:MYXO-CTERM domain-containing protein